MLFFTHQTNPLWIPGQPDPFGVSLQKLPAWRLTMSSWSWARGTEWQWQCENSKGEKTGTEIEYSQGSGRFLIHDHCRYTEIRKDDFSSEVLASDPGGLSSVILFGALPYEHVVANPLGRLACSGINSQWLELVKVWGSQFHVNIISFTCLSVI